MKNSVNLGERIFSILEEPVAEEGLELVDVEYIKEHGGWLLRLVIDKAGGVDLDDCALISHKASDLLDRHDPIDHAYRLEVSSPGLDRPLKTKKDFVRFQGEWVEVHLYAALHGKKTLVGELVSSDDQTLCIRPEKEDVLCVEREKISKVNLYIRF